MKVLWRIAIISCWFGLAVLGLLTPAQALAEDKNDIYGELVCSDTMSAEISQPLVGSEQDYKSSGINTLPALPFVENKVQADSSILFYSDSSRGAVGVGNNELIYFLAVPKNVEREENPDLNGLDANTEFYIHNIKEKFLGACLDATPYGIDAAPVTVNYFRSQTKDNWMQGLKTYAKIMLGEIYSNIQVELIKRGQDTEKVFTIFPGGNPGAINIQVQGGHLELTEAGELAVINEYGSLSFTRPIAYQDIDGIKTEVEVSYRIMDNNVYGFSLAAYNPNYPLIIDPLYYSTYIGGDEDEYLVALETDGEDNIYILARTRSLFSYTAEGYSDNYAGENDVMVAKMSPDLISLLAVTYIGGSLNDNPKDIAIADDGDLLIVGETYSSDFPVTAGAFAENLTGDSDAFIVRLSPDLAELRASTYYGGEGGGSRTDTGNGIAVNSQGRIYIAGTTGSKELPMTESGYKTTKTLGNYGIVYESEAFVAAFSPDLKDLLAATFLAPGGSRLEGDTLCYAMEIGNDDRVYLNGESTVRRDHPFPITEGAFDENIYANATFTHPVYYISGFDADLTDLEVSSAFNTGVYSSEIRSHSWGGFTLDSDSNVIYTAYTDTAIWQGISSTPVIFKFPLDLNADGVVYKEAGHCFRIQDIRYNRQAGQPYITAVSEGSYSQNNNNFDAYILKDNSLIFNEKDIDLDDNISPYYWKTHYFVAGIHPDLQVAENYDLWWFSSMPYTYLLPFNQINTSSAIILTDVAHGAYDRAPHRVMPLAFNSDGDVYMGVSTKSEVLPVNSDSYQDFVAGLYDGGILCLSSDLAKVLSSDMEIQVGDIEEREEGGQKRVRIPVLINNQGPDGPVNAKAELTFSPIDAINNISADLVDGDSLQINGNKLWFNLNNIPLAQTKAFEINADLAEGFSGTLNVSASVQAQGADDPNLNNNTSTEEKPININQYCDLWVNNTNVSSGSNGWQHNIEIGNYGPWGAENVTIKNYLSQYVNLLSAEPEGYSYDSEQHMVSWGLDSLAQGISYADEYKLYSEYKDGISPDTAIENRVVIESDTEDSDYENNELIAGIGGNYNGRVLVSSDTVEVNYLHEFTMRFSIKNTGQEAFRPEISLSLPLGAELIKAATYAVWPLGDGPTGTANNSGSDQNIVWNLRNILLEKDQSLELTATFKVIDWNSDLDYKIIFKPSFKGFDSAGELKFSQGRSAMVEIIRPDIQYISNDSYIKHLFDFDSKEKEFNFNAGIYNGDDALARGMVKVQLNYNGASEKIKIKQVQRLDDSETDAVELDENQWEWIISPGLDKQIDSFRLVFTAGPYAPGEKLEDTQITLNYSYIEGEYDYSEHELDNTNHNVTIPVTIKEIKVPSITLKTTADYSLLMEQKMVKQVYTSIFNLSNTETMAEKFPFWGRPCT